VAATAAAGALLAPGAARADTSNVSIPGRYFSPPRVTVVAGDSVTWSNSDFNVHTVTARDGSFASGRLSHGLSFSHAFPTVGQHPYVCTIHAFMAGEIDVVAATLSAPAGSALAGQPVTLRGRAGAGAAAVTLQRQAGGAWQDVASTAPAAGGAFSFVVRPDVPTAYRVHTTAGDSAPVTVSVISQLRVRLRVHRAGRGRNVALTVTPPTRGLVATLQVYVLERYAWLPLARARVDSRGRATFRLRHRRRGLVRAVVSRGRHAPPLVVGSAVRLRNGRHGMPPPVGPPMGDGPMGDAPMGDRPMMH
jgi:plastocyanin